MPSEVSDIKQFIEICRRKDAKCMFCTSTTITGKRRRRIRGEFGQEEGYVQKDWGMSPRLDAERNNRGMEIGKAEMR